MAGITIRVPITDLADGMVYKTPYGRARWIRVHSLGAPQAFHGETIREAVVSYVNGRGAGLNFRIRLFDEPRGYEVRVDSLPTSEG